MLFIVRDLAFCSRIFALDSDLAQSSSTQHLLDNITDSALCRNHLLLPPRMFRSSYLNKEKSLANNKLTQSTSTHYHLMIFMIHPKLPQTVPCHPIYAL